VGRIEDAVSDANIEARTRQIGRALLAEMGRYRPGVAERAEDWLLTHAVADPHFRTRMLRFLDVLAAFEDPRQADEVARLFREYFSGDFPGVPAPLRALLALGRASFVPAPVIAGAARKGAGIFASRFITNPSSGGTRHLIEELAELNRFPESSPQPSVTLGQIEAVSKRVGMAEDLEALLQVAMDACRDLVGCEHAFVMLADETGGHLYTVASIGYGDSGAGSEVHLGQGLVGLAAARRQSVRVTHMARDARYAHVSQSADSPASEGEVIPLPGLPSVQSQLVTPMLAYRQLVGVIVLQSERIGAFQAQDECLVGILANQAAVAMTLLASQEQAAPEPVSEPEAATVAVKYYAEDESVFLDNEYLIKGIAGGILWRLLKAHQFEGREEFTNRELRLDATLELPDIKDNLEARLILLRKRLEERCDYLRIEKVARGRFRLVVTRPIALVPVEANAPAR
jgi:hypothetical protein